MPLPALQETVGQKVFEVFGKTRDCCGADKDTIFGVNFLSVRTGKAKKRWFDLIGGQTIFRNSHAKGERATIMLVD